MKAIDVIIIAAVVSAVGLAVWFIVSRRKKGCSCCSASGLCSGKCSGDRCDKRRGKHNTKNTERTHK